MKFGVNLVNRGEMATTENLTRLTQRAEALGLDSITISDHIVVPRKMPSNYPYHPEGKFAWESARNYLEPLASLFFLAGKTERIRLGVSVLIVSYRNPIATAKMLATADVLSGGRMFLGIGTGWWEDEYKALGIGGHFADRGARTDEYLRIYKTLWSEENPAFEGQYHSFSDLEFSPRPLQPGGLPIWVGGHTKRALRRTVELGDAWHPIGLRPPANLDPAEFAVLVGQLREISEKAGRDPATIGVAFRAPVGIGESTGQPLMGSAEQVSDDIHSYISKGMTHLTMDLTGTSFNGNMEQLEQIAAEVMPNFA